MFCIRRASRRGRDVRLHRNCSSTATSIAKGGGANQGAKKEERNIPAFLAAGFFFPRRRRRHVSARLLASFFKGRIFLRASLARKSARSYETGEGKKGKERKGLFGKVARDPRCDAFAKLSFSFSSRRGFFARFWLLLDLGKRSIGAISPIDFAH